MSKRLARMSCAVRPRKPMLRRVAFVGAVAAILLAGVASTRSAGESPGGFLFAALGDSRPMMYLPYKQGQGELTKLFVEMFGLVLPARVAEAVVKRDVRMLFDPVTKDLIQIDMPLYTGSEHTRLTLRNGWITEASVEDVKLLPGVRDDAFGWKVVRGWLARW